MTEDTSTNERPGTERATPADLYATVCKAVNQAASLLAPPESAGKHFRESRIEFLKGMRELIDYRIDRLSRRDAKGTRVVVE